MKTLIVYATRHGSSEKAATILKSSLTAEVTLHNLKKKICFDLNEFDSIIVGGSIHAGVINQRVKKFCEDNFDLLLKKYFGIFICCMDKEKAQIQFEQSYDANLRSKSVANGMFGGEFLFENMNWFERLAVKKIAGVHKTTSEIDEEAINNFASKFNLLSK